MEIKELADRARKFNIQSAKRKAVANKSNLLEDLQRKQMRQGEDAKGNPISPSYSGGYETYKATLPTYFAPIGLPDLFLKGGFHKGIRMKITGDDYSFDSSDSKSDALTGKYGDIWGLNPTSMPQAVIACTNEFNEIAGKELGLL